MAAFYRLPSGLWRAQVNRNGVRRSQAFPLKGQAVAWAGEVESEIMAGARGEIPNLTLAALFKRYADEVSTGKKGERWEKVRLEALGRDRLALVKLRALDSPHVADWQQRRLQAVSAASVRRERNLLNAALEIARKEWKWIKRNPFEGVRRPKDAKPRNRLATDEEIGKVREKASEALNRAITVAIETGMRAGEMASVKVGDVRGRVAVLRDTKNGTSRTVALSAAALKCLPVGLTAGSISELWKRTCQEAKVEGLTFHDLRRYAITRLARKLTPFELASMVGHKDLRMTLNVYYKADPEEIAGKLD